MERHYTTNNGGMSTPHTTVFFGWCWPLLADATGMTKVKEKTATYMQHQPKRVVGAVVGAGDAPAPTCNQVEIGARMKAAREVLGLSRPAFTTKCGGVTVRTLENNEGGANEAGAGLVAAFVRLGINANWLLTGEGPMLLKDLVIAQQPKINVAALSAIVEGLIKAGAPPDKVGPTALRYYEDSIAQGVITPDGIDSGGKAAA